MVNDGSDSVSHPPDDSLLVNDHLDGHGVSLFRAPAQANPHFEPPFIARNELHRHDPFVGISQNLLDLGLKDLTVEGILEFSVGTMCSGSDSPILALREIRDALVGLGLNAVFKCQHMFSVEIESYKQSFIERNSKPIGEIFRDVVDVSDPSKNLATTAHGAVVPVPEAPDILVAGTSCVDFSNQNVKKKVFKNGRVMQPNWEAYNRDKAAIEPRPPADRVEVEAMLAEARQAFSTDGESTRTFFSVLEYAYRKRPPIIIMENVSGAPWAQMTDFWLPTVGYRAAFARVDSKDFLVPQTRNRGYLIAVDAWSMQNNSSKVVEEWPNLMRAQKWFRKQVPTLDRFLLPPFDRRIVEARFMEERRIAENLQRETEARMCSYDHASARRGEELGQGHPYTQLDLRGNLRLLDSSWQGYLRIRGWRVHDLLDITYLRGFKEGVDLTHKTRSMDLGQGVDRVKPSTGVVGCILPDGDIFLTDQGRPVLGIEALALQGLPVGRICTSVETQAQLHDLAGNAMTATVVGAAVMCAVIAHTRAAKGGQASFLRLLDGKQDVNPIFDESVTEQTLPIKTPISPIEMEGLDMEPLPAFATSAMRLAEATVLRLVQIQERGRRYCPCSGYRKHNPARGLRRCLFCNEVRCDTCAGNPTHCFESFTVPAVQSDDETIYQLKELLPGRFRLAHEHVSSAESIVGLLLSSFSDHPSLENQDTASVEALADGLSACLDAVYYFDDVDIGRDIGVTYTSTKGRVRLVIGSRNVIWYILLNESSEAFKQLGLTENQPIARAALDVASSTILPRPADWELFVPSVHTALLSLRFAADGFHCTVKSFGDAGRPLCQRFVAAVNGQYELSRNCGTPMSLLYVKRNQHDEVFHFLHSKPLTHSAEDDRWIFAQSAHKPNPAEYREVLCELPMEYAGKEKALRGGDNSHEFECRIPGFWINLGSCSQSAGIRIARFPPQIIQPRGLSFETLYIGSNLKKHFPDSQQRLIPALQLRVPVPDIHFSALMLPQLWKTNGPNFLSLIADSNSAEVWSRVSPHHHRDVLRLCQFALNKLTAANLLEVFAAGLLSHDVAICEKLDAELKFPRRYLTWENGKITDRFNDPQEVQRFDEQYFRRPAVFALAAQLVEAGGQSYAGELYPRQPRVNNVFPEFLLRILVNPTTMAHQAWTHLPRQGLKRGVRRDFSTDATIGFGLDVDFVDPSLKALPPFSTFLSTNSPQAAHLPSQICQPPSFAKNQVELREDQQQAVAWMVERESCRSKWVEREFEEYIAPPSGIRLRAHAEVINRARGGVLAHDVGYGKTVVTLGLIDQQRLQTPQGSIDVRLQWTGKRHLHMRATLIVCPPQIVSQWQQEAHKFLGSEWKVITIMDSKKITSGAFKSADIIIVSSSVLQASIYLKKLSSMAGSPNARSPQKLSDRDLTDWYAEVIDGIECHHEQWDGKAEDVAALIRQRRQQRALNHDRARGNIMASTTRKARPVGNKRRKEAADGAQKADYDRSDNDATELPVRKKVPADETPSSNDINNVFGSGSLLQLYSFERIVLDEFSYDNKVLAAFFTSAVAGSKWILSGTPPLADLGQVCGIAQLLNMHVARAEPSVPAYFPVVTEGVKLDHPTMWESAQAFKTAKSAQFALDRHKQASEFLLHKARRRETDVSDIQVAEKVVVCFQDPGCAIVYAQLQQLLYDAKWDVEDVTGAMKNVFSSLLSQTGDETAEKKGGKARENLRTAWRNAIRSLLVQSSSDLSAYVASLRKTGFNFNGFNGTAELSQSVLVKVIDVYQRQLDRCRVMIKSQLDMTMYLAALVKQDDPDYPLNKAQESKRSTYLGHFQNFIQAITSPEPFALGGDDIRVTAANSQLQSIWSPEGWPEWLGGNGTNCPLDWWSAPDAEALSKLGQAERRHIEDRLNRHVREYLHGSNDASPSQMTEEWAEALEQHRSHNADEVAAKVGLKAKEHLDHFWPNKLLVKDFEFGNKLRSQRPTRGETYEERGSENDQVVGHFIAAFQSVEAGCQLFVQQSRRLRVLLRAHELTLCEEGVSAANGFPRLFKCDVCKEQVPHSPQQLHLFFTCGHLLCSDCALQFKSREAGLAGEDARCPVAACDSLNRSALVPCEQLMSKSPTHTSLSSQREGNLDSSSAKVEKIKAIIKSEIPAGEKVLLFVNYGELKKRLFDALKQGGIDVLMTSGGPQDSRIIDKFRRGNETKVLIQSLMASESAGTNLTEANHIMFAAPLHTDTRNYYMYERQAKGRAIRQGQKRQVHVYHFVTAHTMEVDVLEQRLRQPLLLGEGADRIDVDAATLESWSRQLLFGEAAVVVRNNSQKAVDDDNHNQNGVAPTSPAAVRSQSVTDDSTGANSPTTAAYDETHESTPPSTPSSGDQAFATRAIRSHMDPVQIRKLLESQEYEEWHDVLVLEK